MNETINQTGQATPLKDVLRGHQEAHQSDLDRHRASGGRLLENAQARLARAEHEHLIGRARILADAQAQLAGLKQRARDQLFAFDRKQERLIAELEDEVQTLLDLREAGG